MIRTCITRVHVHVFPNLMCPLELYHMAAMKAGIHLRMFTTFLAPHLKVFIILFTNTRYKQCNMHYKTIHI